MVMTILLDLPVVTNKANFAGWPSSAACPSWFQGQIVPQRENAVPLRYRGDPNRAKQSQFSDEGIHFNIFAAQELCEIALETGREKQSQFQRLAQPGRKCASQHPACDQTGSQRLAFLHFLSQKAWRVHYMTRTIILGVR
jgi:hypothetical protein